MIMRIVLFAALAMLPADCFQARNDSTITKATDRTKVESSYAVMINDHLFRSATETFYKDCVYTIEKNGQKEQVVKKVPCTVARMVPVDLLIDELMVFDRRGDRIDSSVIPKLFKDAVPVLIVPGPKVDAETLKSLKKERLILILPPSRRR